jgi:hypothetical protein
MKGAVKWADSVKAVRTRPTRPGIVETDGVAVAIIKQAFSPVTILVRVTAMEQALDRLLLAHSSHSAFKNVDVQHIK